jgi:hypothetical protein
VGDTYRHSEKQGSKGMDGCPLTVSVPPCIRCLSNASEVRAEKDMGCRQLSVSRHPEGHRTLNTKVIGFVGVVPGDGANVWERYIWTRGE